MVSKNVFRKLWNYARKALNAAVYSSQGNLKMFYNQTPTMKKFIYQISTAEKS